MRALYFLLSFSDIRVLNTNHGLAVELMKGDRQALVQFLLNAIKNMIKIRIYSRCSYPCIVLKRTIISFHLSSSSFFLFYDLEFRKGGSNYYINGS